MNSKGFKNFTNKGTNAFNSFSPRLSLPLILGGFALFSLYKSIYYGMLFIYMF